MARIKRAAFYLSGGLCLLLALLFVLLGWLVFTEAGARFALQRALPLLPVTVQYYDLTGNLWGGLRLRQLSVSSAPSDALGFDHIAASQVHFRWQPLALLGGRAEISQLAVNDLTVQLPAATSDAGPFELPVLSLPVQISIKRLQGANIRIQQSGSEWVIPDFRASLAAGGDKVIVSGLRLNFEGVDYRLSARARLRETLEYEAQLVSHGVTSQGSCRADVALWCRAELHWDNFQHPLTEEFESPSGSLALELQDRVLTVTGEADLRWPFAHAPIDTRLTLDGDVDLSQSQVRLRSLSGTFEQGQVRASGSLDWAEAFSMALQVEADALSLAHWLPPALAESSVSLRSKLTLRTLADGVDLTWSLAHMNLNFGARPLTGQAELYVQPSGVGLRNLSLAGDSGQLTGDAYYGFDEQVRVQAALNTRNLAAMVPELAGAADLRLALAGTVYAPSIQLTVDGRALALADWQVGELLFNADISASAGASASLPQRLEGLRVEAFSITGKAVAQAGQPLGDISVALNGSAVDHRLQVQGQAAAGGLALHQLTVNGALVLPSAARDFSQLLAGLRWRPRIAALSLADGIHAQAWTLEQPSAGELSQSQLDWQPLCLQQQLARLCWDKLQLRDWQALQASGRVAGFYLDRERSLYADYYSSLPQGWLLRGEASADWQVAAKFPRGAVTALTLDVAMALKGAGLRYEESGETALDLPVESFRLRIAGDEKQLDAQGTAELADRERVTLTASARQWLGANREAEASLRGNLSQLRYLQPFVPSVQALDGKLAMDLAVKLPKGHADPVYDGRIVVSDLSLLVPTAGTEVSDWRLVLEAEQGHLQVSGGGKLGEGSATVEGVVTAARGAQGGASDRLFDAKLRIAGQRLTLVNLPDMTLRASPDLTLRGRGRNWRLSGEVLVEDSGLTLKQLPESAVGISEDARVYGAEQPEPQRSLLNFTSDVTLRLGQNVNFEGFGLTTSVNGSLRYSRDEHRANSMHGVVGLPEGRFRSYGQKLDIEDGRIIFSGPVDNPALDVRAARKIDNVEAGIWLTGTAKHPKTELYSSPAMSEADVLAYIVSGKPISQSGQGDLVDMQSAALSLGLKQALPLLQRIGGQLGLSDISIEETSKGGSSIAAGKRLSDKLYVKYVYGLIGAAGNFVVQYKLSDQLTLETSSGETQAIDLTYSWDSKPPTPEQAAAELAPETPATKNP